LQGSNLSQPFPMYYPLEFQSTNQGLQHFPLMIEV
jgi:hypothetical protein